MNFSRISDRYNGNSLDSMVFPSGIRPQSATDQLLNLKLNPTSHDAFSQLESTFAKPLHDFLVKRWTQLARKVDLNFVDDLLQEVWLKVLKNIDSFNPERGQAKSWLFSIANNCCIDAYRRDKKMSSLEETRSENGAEDRPLNLRDTIPSREEESSSLLIEGERQLLRQKLIANIGKKCGAVKSDSRDLDCLVRWALNNETYDMIAMDQKIPVGTLKSRFLKLRTFIRRNFNGEYQAIEN